MVVPCVRKVPFQGCAQWDFPEVSNSVQVRRSPWGVLYPWQVSILKHIVYTEPEAEQGFSCRCFAYFPYFLSHWGDGFPCAEAGKKAEGKGEDRSGAVMSRT